MTRSRQSDLLLIDDDRSLAALLEEYCQAVGFSMTCAYSGEDGIAMIKAGSFGLVILDVMLPGFDGFETLTRIRRSSKVPVLMLTTRNSTVDRIRGLNEGADDYLPKPFIAEELIARVKSILRRTESANVSSVKSAGDVVLDESSRVVKKNGNRVELTGAQYELLRLLLDTPGEALAREELIAHVFGRAPYGVDRSIDNLVNSLRKRLGAHADGNDRFRSIRNVGYSYVLPGENSL